MNQNSTPGGYLYTKEAVHMDWEHQQNKPNKGHSEKIEFNERGLRREGAVLKNEHVRKNIPTLYNS